MANWIHGCEKMFNLDLFHRIELEDREDLNKWFLVGYVGSPEIRQILRVYPDDETAFYSMFKLLNMELANGDDKELGGKIYDKYKHDLDNPKI